MPRNDYPTALPPYRPHHHRPPRIYDHEDITSAYTLAIYCLTATAAAQDASAPVSDALRSTAKRAGTNLIAAAEEMPAGKYGFKPTPAPMSFGDVIAHLSEGNDFLCSTIAGVAAPKRSEVAGGAAKEKLVARLRETFRFCESALAKVVG